MSTTSPATSPTTPAAASSSGSGTAAERSVAVDGFRGPQVCEIVGITYRQLDYWARTNLLRPSIADARGSGSQRVYSYRDLVELKVIKSLIDGGVSLQSARTAIDYLREHLGEQLASVTFVIAGNTPILVSDDGELIDVVRRGQGVLNILPLGPVVSDLDSKLLLLTPMNTASDRAPADPGSGSAGVAATGAATGVG